MAISIDDVYQKVLAIANKEQRGYITPQEFNLFANKAQKEIFDSYFHDLKTSYHKPIKTDMTYGDEMDILSEKLHSFKTSSSWTQEATTSTVDLPSDLYYIDVILINTTEVVELSKKEILYTESNPLTKATSNRPVYVRGDSGATSNSITLYPALSSDATYYIHYYKKPSSPKWNYVVVKGKALYNANLSNNFDLHESEEELLVTRILQLAGVSIEKMELYQVATADGASIKQSQND